MGKVSCFMFLKDESACGEFKRESKLVPNSGASMYQRYYGSFEAMSLNERKYYGIEERASLLCSGLGILVKLPNKFKKCMYARYILRT